MSEDQPFLARWSRLKRQEAERSNTPPREPASPDKPSDETVPAVATAEESFDLSSLPRLEDLTADTDMRVFLDPRVPDDLRTAALRKAWRLDPHIDSFIEVAENQYDWNTPGGAPGYGPFQATADLAGLLAQATGRLLLDERDEPHDAPKRENVDAAPENDAAVQDAATRDLAPQSEALPAHHAVTESALEPAQTRAADIAAGTRRHRHGSALPS
jgi:hypothetical protein